MKNKFYKMFVFLIPLGMSLSSCSDFRKAVGKEKVIPDEFAVAMTPSLIVPPGYNIDTDIFNNNGATKAENDFNLSSEINVIETNQISSFQDLFVNKRTSKDIRKLVDEETLGISLSERTGIDMLFGQVPETGIVLDAKKEALRIKKNKSLGKKINSTPSPAFEKNSGKSVLIK